MTPELLQLAASIDLPIMVGWIVPAIAIAAKFAGDYLGDRANRKAGREADQWNAAETARRNAYEQQVYEAKLAESRAMAEASAAQLRAQIGVQGEQFGMLKEAGEKEAKAREKFAKGLKEFGGKSKEAHIAAGRAKKRAAIRGAVKGKRGKGGISKAGRRSSAFTTGAAKATQTGHMRGTERASKEAALSAYNTDMRREAGMYDDLRAFGQQAGMAANEQRRLSGQYGTIMNPAIAAQYKAAMAKASLLGPAYLPPYVESGPHRVRTDNKWGQLFDTLSGGASIYTMAGGAGAMGGSGWGGGQTITDPAELERLRRIAQTRQAGY